MQSHPPSMAPWHDIFLKNMQSFLALSWDRVCSWLPILHKNSPSFDEGHHDIKVITVKCSSTSSSSFCVFSHFPLNTSSGVHSKLQTPDLRSNRSLDHQPFTNLSKPSGWSQILNSKQFHLTYSTWYSLHCAKAWRVCNRYRSHPEGGDGGLYILNPHSRLPLKD